MTMDCSAGSYLSGQSHLEGREAAGRQAMSLSQLGVLIEGAIRQTPQLRGVWVMAELSDVRQNATSGHCYLQLLEKSPSGQTVAQMKATIWKFTYLQLDRKFAMATGRRIASGMKVLVKVDTEYKAAYGFSLNITDIDPTYTLGDMERIRREIMARLQSEGLLNANKALSLPINPQRIAVISAPGAAGYGDFMNHINSSSEGYVFYTHLFPAVMQGDKTAPTVLAAMERVMQTHDTMQWDAVVIIRGGGATNDLNGFDNYDIARAVATCPLPVIVGIGHERDVTVLDEIACVRCKTPTAVAGYLIECLQYADRRVADSAVAMQAAITNRFNYQHRLLDRASDLTAALPSQHLLQHRSRLASLSAQLQTAAAAKTSQGRQQLSDLRQSILTASGAITRQGMQHIAVLKESMANAAKSRLELASQRLESLSQMARLLSPANTLERGYSITRCNGHAIRSISEVKPGDNIVTILPDGSLASTITEKSQESPLK